MYEVATLCLQRYKKYDNVENPHMLFMQIWIEEHVRMWTCHPNISYIFVPNWHN